MKRRFRPTLSQPTESLAPTLVVSEVLTCREPSAGLSRREREILTVLYRYGPAAARKITRYLLPPPSNSATRALLAALERKGQVMHELRGATYVYRPTLSIEEARRQAWQALVDTYFQGRVEQALAFAAEQEANRPAFLDTEHRS